MRAWGDLDRDEQREVLRTAASWRDEGIDYDDILDRYEVRGIELSRSGLRGRLSEYRTNLDESDSNNGHKDITARVLAASKKQKSVTDIANYLDVSPRRVEETLSALKEQGYNIELVDGQVRKKQVAVAENRVHIADFDSLHVKFAIVSDTHLCSKHERLDDLHRFYELAKKEGCSKVLHAGDISAGQHVYRGQENELKIHGQDDQIEYVVENYPNGLPTYVISGNHDLRVWEMGGSDPVKAICGVRDDLTYLGQLGAIVEFPRGVRLQLVHPTGGGSYALTYQSQRWVDSLEGGGKPHIIVFGHWHTSAVFQRRNVHIIHAGAWESQSLWLMRKGLQPSIGGYIMEINISDDGSVNRLCTEFIKFF